jgi:hypothetical protein
MLGQTPRRIASITRGVSQSELRRRPKADSWSAAEVLAHLKACADVWGKSIMLMISVENPRLRYVSPRSWIRKTEYLTQDFLHLLGGFRTQRGALLKALRALAASAWSRGATFSGTTKGQTETVLGYALRIAEHEAGHIGQIERALGRTKESRSRTSHS